jgi:large subunit ribosomal protein L40e
MKVLVNLEGEIASFNINENSTIGDLKSMIDNQELYDVDIQRLYLGQIELSDNAITLDSCGIADGSLLDMKVTLLGGAGPVEYLDHLRDLANKYRCNKMICRICYARLPPNAKNCRKRKCGHSANIRPKKKIKEKEGKK